MQVDEAPLAEKYNLVKLSVIGSTRISNRTATIAARLSTSPASEKTVIVALTAKHKAATKLISVVEIAKRDLVANGIKVYQYNALSSELIDMPRAEATEGITNNRAPTSNDDVHSDDAFETMQAKDGDATKKRLIPVMTTYLSDRPIKELKATYGEQG